MRGWPTLRGESEVVVGVGRRDCPCCMDKIRKTHFFPPCSMAHQFPSLASKFFTSIFHPSSTVPPTLISHLPPPNTPPPSQPPPFPLSIPQTPIFVQSQTPVFVQPQTPFPLSKTPRFRIMSANSLRLGMGWCMGT